jgi:hypothetical protein
MAKLHKTREEWLNDLAGKLAPMFTAKGAPLPPRVRIAIGFPSTGGKGRRVGECWDAKASKDATFEILLRPDLDAPAELAHILVHELVHAAVGIAAGHGPKFRKLAVALGLQGKMKSTTAGPELVAALAPILAKIGPLPHAKLDFSGLTTRPKKQTARLIKCECAACGYTVRTTRKWLEEAGAPVCPVKGHGPMTADMPADEEEPEDV